MNIFKKSKKEQQEFQLKTIAQFKEAVKELNELYDEARVEYEALETIVEEFNAFIKELNGRLNEEDKLAMVDFSVRLGRVNLFARNSVRDLRDVLRNQKKRLKEMQHVLD